MPGLETQIGWDWVYCNMSSSVIITHQRCSTILICTEILMQASYPHYFTGGICHCSILRFTGWSGYNTLAFCPPWDGSTNKANEITTTRSPSSGATKPASITIGHEVKIPSKRRRFYSIGKALRRLPWTPQSSNMSKVYFLWLMTKPSAYRLQYQGSTFNGPRSLMLKRAFKWLLTSSIFTLSFPINKISSTYNIVSMVHKHRVFNFRLFEFNLNERFGEFFIPISRGLSKLV